MKLELKHLAPYLPYGLKGIFTLSEVITLVPGQKDEVRDKILTADCVTFFLSYCKPILRPTSDYIDINSNQMNDLCGDIQDQIWIQSFALGFNSLASISYSAYELMVRNHVDCFKLIDAGLAIDFNTL